MLDDQLTMENFVWEPIAKADPDTASTTREWSTVTCECGHAETIDPEAIYHVIPTGRYRWCVSAETSEVSMEHEFVYICEDCWEALPDE